MNKRFGLTSTAIKIAAIVMMLIDHIAAGIIYGLIVNHGYKEYIDLYYRCRYIGRLAFPIFCYILVEGYYHTRNLSQYIGRLFVFALISEVPFDMTIKRKYFELSHQNAYFTLVLGLLSVWCIDYFYHNYRLKDEMRFIGAMGGFALCTLVSYYGKTDYAGIGVVIITLIYLLKKIPMLPVIIGPVMLILWEFIEKYEKGATRYFEVSALLCIPILLLYNGKRGRVSLKWFFYLFYPLHLFIIGFICMRYLYG